MKKRWMIGILAVCLAALAGITAWKMFSFPAKEYAKAALDAMYKERFEDYKELTGASEKELEKNYQKGIQLEMESFRQYFGVTQLTEEGEKQLEEFVRMVNTYLQYEVTGAKKKGESIVVTVKVNPLALYQMVDAKACMKEFRRKAEDGEYLELTDDLYEDAFLAFIINKYEQMFDSEKTKFLGAKEYPLTLKKAGREYIPSNDEFEKIDRALIAFSK